MFSSKIRNILFIIVIALIGGAVPIFGKISLKEIPTFSFTFLRFFIASLVLFPFYLKTKKSFKKDFWKLCALSLFAMGNFVFFAVGIQHTNANISQAIYTLSPILAIIISYLLYKKKLKIRITQGVLIGLIGALIIILLPLISNNAPEGITLWGNIIIFTAALSFTLFTVLSKSFHKKYSSLEITIFFTLATTVVMFFLSFYEFYRDPNWIHHISSKSIFGLFYVGSFGTALYYLLYQKIIKNTSAIFASTILYIQPFATLLWAYVILDEKFIPLFIVGLLISLFGVYIINLEK